MKRIILLREILQQELAFENGLRSNPPEISLADYRCTTEELRNEIA